MVHVMWGAWYVISPWLVCDEHVDGSDPVTERGSESVTQHLNQFLLS